MNKTLLRSYARLIAEVGGNVQKGQEVFITAQLDQPEFVKMLVEECYKCGAGRVVVEWNYQPLLKVDYRYRTTADLSAVRDYEEARWKHCAQVLPCRIGLISEDPSGLNGIDAGKYSTSQQAVWPIYKPYRDAMEHKCQWCFACVPGPAWAKRLFPQLRVGRAMERLWELILTVCRVDGDPVAAWAAHNAELQGRCDYINRLPLKELHFSSGNGTDFRIGMMPEARFKGVRETTKGGTTFTPNLPTEECLITPKKGAAEGIVYGTKPLCFHGQSAENFWIRFHEGKAVEWHAEENNELLTKLIEMDEGSRYLGECALVPFDSPINQTGLLFYNTLFDENACCHLALGMGFADTIRDFQNKTLDECRKLGVNDSMIHEDFMIGSADLSIDAVCEDGKTAAIFRNGTWAF